MESKTADEQKEMIIRTMYGYASENHKSYLNAQAFSDIASVFIEFMNCKMSWDESTRWVCNAPMGHGKTSVLISLCKYILCEPVPNNRKRALLIVIREKGEGKKIAEKLEKLADKFRGKIKYITSDNRDDISSAEIKNAQIVIITHARLKQMVLGCGDIDIFSQWETRIKKKYWGKVSSKDRYDAFVIPRNIIIDEMPDFENTSVFDIGASDNCIKWFDCIVRLPEMIELISNEEIQSYRKLFNGVFNDYKSDIATDVTLKLMNEEMNPDKVLKINRFYEIIDAIEDLQGKISLSTYTDYIHYRKLMYENAAGKVYSQFYNRQGEKIIVSDFVPYNNIEQKYYDFAEKKYQLCRANILILDGTGKYGTACYKAAKFEARFVKNYNDYTRLTLHHRDINTSADSRSKEDTVLREVLCDYESLLKKKKIFLLPALSDIRYVVTHTKLTDENLKAITIDEKAKYEDKRLHMLNTRGKNDLKDVTDMYMTCLPRKSALTYATLAVALYGTGVDIRIRSNISEDDPTKCEELQWFNDSRVETLYLLDLAAELLQIIHRTALRKITGQEKINVYIAFDEPIPEGQDKSRVFRMLQAFFTNGMINMKQDATYTYLEVYNGSIYGRNKKIEKFAAQVKEVIDKSGEQEVKLSKKYLGEIGKEITHFFKANDNWNKNKDAIVERFKRNGLKLEERGKRTKVFTIISD